MFTPNCKGHFQCSTRNDIIRLFLLSNFPFRVWAFIYVSFPFNLHHLNFFHNILDPSFYLLSWPFIFCPSLRLSIFFFLFLLRISLPLTGSLQHSGCCNIDENRIEQCFAAHIVHSCQQYWTILLHPIQAQQYCSILLTSVNNVGSKTLFSPVEQRARRFFAVYLVFYHSI